MASLSPFVKNKLIRVFATFFDMNDDCKIEWADFELSVERFRNLHSWDKLGKEHTSALEIMNEIWCGLKKYADENQDNIISMEEWCNMWADCIRNVKVGQLADWHKKYMDFMFDATDTSGDDVIDKEEYTNVYMSYGLSKENCQLAFDTFSHSGKLKVDRGYFRALWLEYFSSEDPAAMGNHIFGMLEADQSHLMPHKE